MQPRVSITTVLYNSADCLRDCFISIADDSKNGFAELLIVDNSSPDNSVEIVKNEFPFAHLIYASQNKGFAAGCNLAWSKVSADYWLLLNPDTVVPPNLLQEIVKWMDMHPEIGAASPDIINEEGASAFPGRRFPSIYLSLLEISRIHLLFSAEKRSKMFLSTYLTDDNQIDADWVPGTFLIVRRQVVEEVGLLSEKLFMYGEDIEWCWRIKKAGWKIAVCKSLKVLHLGSTSAKQTWGEIKTNERIQRATYKAVELMRGKLYKQLLIITHSFGQIIELCHPTRSKQWKIAAKRELKINWSIFFGKDSD